MTNSAPFISMEEAITAPLSSLADAITLCQELMDPGITKPNENTHSSRHVHFERVPSWVDRCCCTMIRWIMLRLLICFLEWKVISRETASQFSTLTGISTAMKLEAMLKNYHLSQIARGIQVQMTSYDDLPQRSSPFARDLTHEWLHSVSPDSPSLISIDCLHW